MASKASPNFYPLPSGWDCSVTEDGRIFFIDERNRRTTWIHPTINQPILTGLHTLQDLPPGWEVDTTNDGRLYYIDHTRGVTTFEPPPLTPESAPLSPGSPPETPQSPNSPHGKEDHFKRGTPKQRSVKAPSAKRNPEATVVKRGWLHRLESSGLSKAWKRRWCVLADFALFVYKGEDEESTLSSILLPSYKINPCTEADNIKRNFVFKVEHENTKTLYFATDDSPELISWMSLLRQAATMNGSSGFHREANNNYRQHPLKEGKAAPVIGPEDQSPLFSGQVQRGPGYGVQDPMSMQNSAYPDPMGYGQGPPPDNRPQMMSQSSQSPSYRGYGDPASTPLASPNDVPDHRGFENPIYNQDPNLNQPPQQRNGYANGSNRNSVSNISNRGSQVPTSSSLNSYNPEAWYPAGGGGQDPQNPQRGYNGMGQPSPQGQPDYNRQNQQSQPPGQQRNSYLKDGFAPDSTRNSLAHSDTSSHNRHSYHPAQVERDRLKQELGYNRQPNPDASYQEDPKRDSYSDEGERVRQLNPWDQNFPAGPDENSKHASFHNLLFDANGQRQNPRTFNARSKSFENFSSRPSQPPPQGHSQQPGNRPSQGQNEPSPQQHRRARGSYSKENQSPAGSHGGFPLGRDMRDNAGPRQGDPSQYNQQRSPNYPPNSVPDGRDPYTSMRDPRERYNQDTGQGSQRPQYLQQDRRSYASNTSSPQDRGQGPIQGQRPQFLQQDRRSFASNSSQGRGSLRDGRPGTVPIDQRGPMPQQTLPGHPAYRDDPRQPPPQQGPGSYPPHQRGPSLDNSTSGSAQRVGYPYQQSHDISQPSLHLDLNTSQPSPSQNDGHPHTYVNFPNRRPAGNGPGLNNSQEASGGSHTPPVRPPYPTAVRNQIVEELAQTKTPVTQNDFLTSAQLNSQRMQQPSYFQYPSPRDEKGNRIPNSQPGNMNQTMSSLHNQSNSRLSTASRNSLASRGDHKDSPSSPPRDNYTRDMSDPEAQKLRMAYERVHSLRMSPDKAPPKRKPAPIQTVKEDPNMSDRDILETNLQKIAKKNPLSGPRLRMSISAGDLIGKTHDELVLLLIQLRRNQAALEKTRDFYRNQIQNNRPAEQEFRKQIHQFGEVHDRRLHESHRNYVEARSQMEEIENKLEVYRPIINLLDNMVTMGSLYGGDNLMLATQYRKHLLRPDQYQPPKKMLEFSRRHQEDRLIQETQEEIKQLTSDEVRLEEKIDRLNELDRLLQEQSFKVSSFKQDKELMERALSGMLRQQDQSMNDPCEMVWLTQQQRSLEKEISRVTQQLAEASKMLEETTAENNKLEHEVALLRSKVNGELTRSRSAPSLASENVRTKVKMERELSKVEDIMSGLNKEGERLSQAMKSIRRSSSGTHLAGLGQDEDSPSRHNSSNAGGNGTYYQTDLDSGDQVDLAMTPSWDLSGRQSGVFDNSDGGGDGNKPIINHHRQNASAQEDWDMDGADENTRKFFGLLPRDKPKGQTVRDVKRLSIQRKEREKKKEPDEFGEEIKLRVSNVDNDVSSIIHARIPSDISNKDSNPSLGHWENGSQPLYENLPRYKAGQGDFDSQSASSSRRSSLILMAPKPFTPYQDKSARPFKSELALNASGLPQFDNGIKTEETPADSRMYRSAEILNDTNPRDVYNGGLINNNQGGTSPYGYRPVTNGPSFAQEKGVTPSGQFFARPYVANQPNLNDSRGQSEVIPMTSSQVSSSYSQPLNSAYSQPDREPGSTFDDQRNSKGRFSTISSSQPFRHEANTLMHPTLHNTAGDLILNRTIDDVPDIVKSSQTKEDHIDPDTIDREILYIPDKVLIPERYDAELDAEHLTEEEKQRRREKAEKIKKMLASQSVLSMSQPDISHLPSEVIHSRVQQERQERAHFLALGQELAKQVTLASKKQAAERRKTWSGAQFAEVKKQYDLQQQTSPSSPLRSPDGERKRAEITLKDL